MGKNNKIQELLTKPMSPVKGSAAIDNIVSVAGSMPAAALPAVPQQLQERSGESDDEEFGREPHVLG